MDRKMQSEFFVKVVKNDWFWATAPSSGLKIRQIKSELCIIQCIIFLNPHSVERKQEPILYVKVFLILKRFSNPSYLMRRHKIVIFRLKIECIRFCIILILLIYLQFNPLKIHLNTIFRRSYLGITRVKLTFNVVHPKFYYQNNCLWSKMDCFSKTRIAFSSHFQSKILKNDDFRSKTVIWTKCFLNKNPISNSFSLQISYFCRRFHNVPLPYSNIPNIS